VNALSQFDAVWDRCAQLSTLHAYLSNNVAPVVQPDELLRAEWVARVSALDLYIHELVAQLMLATFSGLRAPTPAYMRFQVPNDVVHRIRTATNPSEAVSAFDLFIRTYLSRVTFQEPEAIADGVRLCSTVELWNEIALNLGASQTTKNEEARALKKRLSLIVQRRNIIAHEGDLKQTPVREPWPIVRGDLTYVSEQLERVVRAIDAVVS